MGTGKTGVHPLLEPLRRMACDTLDGFGFVFHRKSGAPRLSQEPIASHPNASALLKQYGGYPKNGKIVWPDRLPELKKAA